MAPRRCAGTCSADQPRSVLTGRAAGLALIAAAGLAGAALIVSAGPDIEPGLIHSDQPTLTSVVMPEDIGRGTPPPGVLITPASAFIGGDSR